VENQKRFPTFPPGARDDHDGSLAEPKTKERKSAAPRPPHSPNRLSLQSSKTDFMLIFQLENADKPGTVAPFRGFRIDPLPLFRLKS